MPGRERAQLVAAHRTEDSERLRTADNRIRFHSGVRPGDDIIAINPFIDAHDSYVATTAFPDPDVMLMRAGLHCRDAGDDLVGYLARTTSAERSAGGARFVEAGVGRTYLLSGTAVTSRPDLVDFAVTGVGKTQYCTEGFPDVGSPLDGYCALEKILHRQRIGETLERNACRVPLIAAIVALPGLHKSTIDGRNAPAALMVRGSRMVMRLQQLDPVHGFTHADDLYPSVLGTMYAELDRDDPDLDGIAHLAARHWHVRPLTRTHHYQLATTDRQATAVRIRCEIMYRYAETAIAVARRRLESELGRPAGTLSVADYASWFADEMGRQLAAFRRIGLLFDYRVVRDEAYAATLNEGQVSLLAEFHDLETAVLVHEDKGPGVYLNDDEFGALRDRFEFFHERDVYQAAEIVKSVVMIALPDDLDAVPECLRRFCSAYDDGVA